MPVHKLIKAWVPKSKSFDALAVAGWKLVKHKYYLFLSSWDAPNMQMRSRDSPRLEKIELQWAHFFLFPYVFC